MKIESNSKKKYNQNNQRKSSTNPEGLVKLERDRRMNLVTFHGNTHI
jgi:hypothetical protein